ncbi:UDP-N-acetylglucosamine 2-epimerase (non-hydrolyzing) [Arthrobacter sp. YD2]|uniref:non-hydrolyzing UDP-N-acetylglucosamine 2-epimerase n=1 Tax=Arthrobacter sp. YD2 TaxID=3058046 RepID=UPI0025B33B18|nr:UDP-N-acetylglucosamine 2-epimerase (non-hydrolyzing) [Arthrobacter sp. YD2]MDN3904214.1 UDP-N-acetylglucosamine 2-epimerase (non-hydrolyzing) [Arthrobacter sp. YD2]
MPVIMPIYGTRPEAIKMAPIIAELKKSNTLECFITVTGQHRSMLDQVNALFDIVPDHDLDIFEPGQSLNAILTRTINGLDKLFSVNRPDAVVVQGDTTTSTAAAMAAFYHTIPVVHVEAGLRSGNLHAPFPEEGNRKITTQISSLHLAPTETSRDNLLAEKVRPENIVVTGNTVVDALYSAMDREIRFADTRLQELASGGRKMLLVTTHRRENQGEAMHRIGRALARIASAEPDLTIVLPIHSNPAVRSAVLPYVDRLPNVHITEPLEYGEFTRLLCLANVVLTDSGGVQEEAASLGTPVLVMRDATERPEVLEAGVAKLVGTNEDSIVSEVDLLLHDASRLSAGLGAVNPYGDGHAARRCVDAMEKLLTADRPYAIRS